MRRIITCLVVALLPLWAANAQPLKPNTPSILHWTPEQQREGYRSIETIYKTATIARGEAVRALGKADRTLELSYTRDGRSWTIDDFMKAFNVSGLMVLKDGKVLVERYGLGRQPQDRWISFSIAKSVTSTLVGAAIQDGKIKSLDDPVTLYIPELKGSGYDGVNLRQMLTMSSGVKWNEDYSDPNADVARSGTTYNEPGVNPIVSYMRRLPRAHEPGSTFHYNTGETHLVGMVVSKATGKSLADYASEKIWKPFGMERDAVWMLDAAGHELGGCCISMTVGDYARFGQFILEGGKAGGPGSARAIVPDGWVAEATGQRIIGGALPQGIGYGYFWWVGSSGGFSALGIFGQSVTLFPADRLVIVVNSAWPRATDRDLFAGRSAFLYAVRDAAKGL